MYMEVSKLEYHVLYTTPLTGLHRNHFVYATSQRDDVTLERRLLLAGRMHNIDHAGFLVTMPKCFANFLTEYNWGKRFDTYHDSTKAEMFILYIWFSHDHALLIKLVISYACYTGYYLSIPIQSVARYANFTKYNVV